MIDKAHIDARGRLKSSFYGAALLHAGTEAYPHEGDVEALRAAYLPHTIQISRDFYVAITGADSAALGLNLSGAYEVLADTWSFPPIYTLMFEDSEDAVIMKLRLS